MRSHRKKPPATACWKAAPVCTASGFPLTWQKDRSPWQRQVTLSANWEKAAPREPGTNLCVRGGTAGQHWAPQEVGAKSGQEAESRIPLASPWVRRHSPRTFQAEVTISIYGLQHIFFSQFLLPTAYFFRTSSLTYLSTGFNYLRKYLHFIFLQILRKLNLQRNKNPENLIFAFI